MVGIAPVSLEWQLDHPMRPIKCVVMIATFVLIHGSSYHEICISSGSEISPGV